MQIQKRFVSLPIRQVALMAALVVAVALLALLLSAGALRNARLAATSTRIVVAHQQAPDAKDRNDAYARALAARFNNQSPDAQERNIELSRQYNT